MIPVQHSKPIKENECFFGLRKRKTLNNRIWGSILF